MDAPAAFVMIGSESKGSTMRDEKVRYFPAAAAADDL